MINVVDYLIANPSLITAIATVLLAFVTAILVAFTGYYAKKTSEMVEHTKINVEKTDELIEQSYIDRKVAFNEKKLKNFYYPLYDYFTNDLNLVEINTDRIFPNPEENFDLKTIKVKAALGIEESIEVFKDDSYLSLTPLNRYASQHDYLNYMNVPQKLEHVISHRYLAEKKLREQLNYLLDIIYNKKNMDKAEMDNFLVNFQQLIDSDINEIEAELNKLIDKK
ncbi:hypothetical protein Metev_0462 [Methanohalobium evestigatum Z-7303]|uniref:Uncharacterized protein n=1 Tax=Methanohalobium evestigatum (strain ATCC BAA-1072 / DSM 3721 / NBRC 107634 / OCM 161 / Z-7303) TaxID=644295 RepID=D7E835_METEZ|nr:hypothetical protein [Methanohalobium evestigatum]ADI73377.1 hypothetical protein Metev_0462 [Methanohalobium evestigatum Z-7303]